jgi:hypothetical protein
MKLVTRIIASTHPSTHTSCAFFLRGKKKHNCCALSKTRIVSILKWHIKLGAISPPPVPLTKAFQPPNLSFCQYGWSFGCTTETTKVESMCGPWIILQSGQKHLLVIRDRKRKRKRKWKKEKWRNRRETPELKEFMCGLSNSKSHGEFNTKFKDARILNPIPKY